MTNTELVELLRDTRRWVGHNLDCTSVCDECVLAARIDAALAEHDAVPPSEAKWRPIGVFGDVDEYVATIGHVNMTVHAEPVSSTGDLLWEVRHTYAASGTAPTLDEAKSAASAAARGMR